MAMVMSRREKYIAYGAGGAVLLLLLNYFIFGPLIAWRDDLDTRSLGLDRKLGDANNTFDLKQKLTKKWTLMQKGLNVDSSTAESQAEQAVVDWADASGLTLTGLRPGKTTSENGFTVISFTATGTGSMPDVAHMLWSLENATIPVRVADLQLKPRKEGTDDLLATFTISALCFPPATPAADHSLTNASASNRDLEP